MTNHNIFVSYQAELGRVRGLEGTEAGDFKSTSHGISDWRKLLGALSRCWDSLRVVFRTASLRRGWSGCQFTISAAHVALP